MLSAEDNVMLTRTGPGTPMGELFRRFWVPVLLAEELPGPDCPQKRVRILGEDFVAFRDSNGTPALMEPHCPHRGAHLFYGRNEKGGIRCAYHGWKFDVSGRCLEAPTMPEGPAREKIQDTIRIRSVPVREWGDMIWAYFGPAEKIPDLPEMEFALLPPTHRHVSKKLQECNWAQACEGGLDTAHFSFLHMSVEADDDTAMKVLNRAAEDPDRIRWMRHDGSPRFKVMEFDAGLILGAARKADRDEYYWRITHFLMPCHGYAPNAFQGETFHGQTWVPIDDVSHWIFTYSWNPERPIDAAERAKLTSGHSIHARVDENYLPHYRRYNDYGLNREDQRLNSFTGIEGVSEQDAAIQDSQGYIADRTRENLGPTDLGVVQFRKLMLGSAKRLMQGEEPPAAHAAKAYHVRSGSHVAPSSKPMETVMVERFGDVHGRVSGPIPQRAAE